MNIEKIISEANIHAVMHDPGAARLVIDLNKVMDKNAVPGLEVFPEEHSEGVNVKIILRKDTIVEKPVHLCFGVSHQTAVQKINMDVTIETGAKIDIIAHCIFPDSKDVQHIMDAVIRLGEGARYSYFEKHIHNPMGGIQVYPKARIFVGKSARFKTDFELIRGRVGIIDIDYEIECEDNSSLEMTAKVSGKADDVIKIRETGLLKGRSSRGVLNSRVAVRDFAVAHIYNKLTATAPYARGHVDCKEIIQDNASASAIPIVEVKHPKAHITHEAAIGSVDNKQLETLMARGLTEDQAVELIIDGLLA
ncbi:SufD family Fe-S cluster assembly protein [bacterium]|nr:SufD family Fe-S cluster assembly protein [candidate division CSSED10-310 bacterium]